MTIPAYFSQIKAILETHAADFVVKTDLNFETRPGDQGYLKGRVTFSNPTVFQVEDVLLEIVSVQGWL
jgi:hypothetical protein